ncbi:MAG: Na+:solute symporter [Saprospiraceae bacterium]|nr:Na+:solute symporter [Saprospiraceae bacterium]
MPFLDYLVILIFSVMILAVGLAFTRSGKNIKSYFAAGGSLPWWLSGLSLFMSFFSAGTFVVWGSIAYSMGWVAVTIQWMMAISGLLIGFYIAPRWKSANVLTVGEFLGNLYGQRLKKFYSYIFLILSFLTTGAFLYPVAKLFNVATGFSIELSVILLGLLVIAYTTAGGLWAVVITDVLQFIILFAAVIIVVPLALDKIGGINEFITSAPTDFFQLTSGEYNYIFLFAFLFYNTIFIGGNWAYVQRYTSVKSPADAKKVGWLFGILYFISPVLWMLPPMIYRGINQDLTGLENEGAFLMICKDVLPRGLLGLMLGGMIFATASSVNTTLNMSAAVFTNDLFKKLKKETSELKLMLVARWSTIVFGLITIGVALMVPRFGGIVEVVLSVGAITGAPLFAPPIWALFSKLQTAQSIITATLTSLAINLYFKFLHPILFGIALNRSEEMLLGVISPLVILFLYELWLRRAKIEKININYTASTSQKTDKAESSGENQFAIRILGIALLATGLLIVALGSWADSGRLITIGVGAIVSLLGVGLYNTALKKPTPTHSPSSKL